MLLARRLEFHLILDSCSSGHRLHISELPWKEAEQAEDFLPVNPPEKGAEAVRQAGESAQPGHFLERRRLGCVVHACFGRCSHRNRAASCAEVMAPSPARSAQSQRGGYVCCVGWVEEGSVILSLP